MLRNNVNLLHSPRYDHELFIHFSSHNAFRFSKFYAPNERNNKKTVSFQFIKRKKKRKKKKNKKKKN